MTSKLVTQSRVFWLGIGLFFALTAGLFNAFGFGPESSSYYFLTALGFAFIGLLCTFSAVKSKRFSHCTVTGPFDLLLGFLSLLAAVRLLSVSVSQLWILFASGFIGSIILEMALKGVGLQTGPSRKKQLNSY